MFRKSSDSRKQPLMIRFMSLDHGVEVGGPVSGMFPVPLVNKAHFAHVRDLLIRRFAFPGFSERIEGVVGTLNRLKTFTTLCKQNGDNISNFAVKFIGCHSQLLTPRWRALLSDFWKVSPTEIYGLSEIPGLIGSRCPHCNYYHLYPTAYLETVDPDTYSPVTSGLARLVATALYPLVEMQPFIRYDTEELVHIGPQCEQTFQPSLEYVGRDSTVIRTRLNDVSVVVVDPMVLHAIVDEEPAVAVKASSQVAAFGLQEIGFRKYAFSCDASTTPKRITIDLELRWSPDEYTQYGCEMKSRMLQRICKSSTHLQKLIASSEYEIQIRLLPPGSLATFAEA